MTNYTCSQNLVSKLTEEKEGIMFNQLVVEYTTWTNLMDSHDVDAEEELLHESVMTNIAPEKRIFWSSIDFHAGYGFTTFT